ncbi:MAG: amidohydrolase family protein [Chitinophagaceae bacterium]|nr:amidohydrolase family protein [Chitinophagaceae bacterium]
MVIDAHVHFWKYSKEDLPWIDRDMKILQKDYLPTELELTLHRNHVDGCIAVQAATEEVETRFLAELANTHPVIKGVVGWTDLRASNVEKKLSELKEYPSIKGIRHIVQSEPDDFLYDENFRAGVSLLKEFGYTYDILIYPRQLKAAVDFVRAFPDQVFILDHSAKPDVKNKEMDMWKKGITDLAMFPNVSCKLSGLITEAAWKEWSPAEFYPYLDVVFQAFGVERLMFGSDWPVMLLSGIYVQWKSLLEKYMEKHLQEEKDAVFGLNAQRIYGF